MPTTEQERCPRHPTAPIVGTCDGCAEPLCLACAVPVRGRILGPVCLETELGDPPAPPEAAPAFPGMARDVADLGLVATVLATVLPWSGVGLGAGPFGAWGTADPRWASLVVLASVGGCAAMATARARGMRVTPSVDRAVAIAALVATVAAMLAIVVPPSYTSPAIGPWVAALAATAATAGSVAVLRRGGSVA